MKPVINIFSTIPEECKKVLFFGNLQNCFGSIKENLINNFQEILAIRNHCINKNGSIDIIVLTNDDYDYVCKIIQKVYEMCIRPEVRNAFFNKHNINILAEQEKTNIKKLNKNINIWTYTTDYDTGVIFNFIKRNCNKSMNYDYIIQNPPYAGSLHLDFNLLGFNMIKNAKGKMTIIEPATWLIDIRKSGNNYKKYVNIKHELEGHVYKVIIENYNKEFNVGLYVPFAITYIDFSKKYNNIEFVCFGEKRIVPNLYECNLIGNYDLIWQILDKILLYKDKMVDHKFNNKIKYDSSTWYATYKGILNRCGCADPRFSDNWFINNIYSPYYHCCLDIRENISNTPIYKLENGRTYDNPAYSSKLADNICDTKEHLENFKYNVYNTKLFVFLAIVLLIQQNPTPNFAPWLVDKCYDDDEIYKLFDFSKDEIQFIEYVIKKFDRYSPWFNRYLKGPSGNISDEEVQKFIDNL